jgi:hypothetical protein
MASKSAALTDDEFASLLTVGNTHVGGSAPAIPAADSARLVALGYMADIGGRLRMTTPGRLDIRRADHQLRRPYFSCSE